MAKATLINNTGQKQVVESGSQQAQALFGQGYTLMGAKPTVNPTLPASLPSSTIVGAQAPSTIVPVNNYDSTDVTSLMAGTDVTSKGLESQLNLAGQTTPAETAKTKLQDEFATTAGNINTTKTAAIKQGQQTYDLEGNTKNVQQIVPQIETLRAEFNAAEIAQEGRKGLAGSIYGRQALIQRQRAVELAGLSAVAQAYQGNITLATDTIEKSVNALYKPQEDYLANLKDQLDFSYKDMDDAEKKKADQLKLVADERLRLIEEEKNKATAIQNFALDLAKSGADSSIISQIIKSGDMSKAIELAAKSGLFTKPTDGQPIKIGQDSDGNDLFYNPTTGSIQTADQLTSSNLGVQVGTIKGLPSYDTRAANPGMTRSDRNNNPGNIKVSDYTKEFVGVVGVESNPAQDGGNFLIFENPQAGLDAIGRLLLEGKAYQGVNAETAIKRYNGNGAYGAKDVGLDPNKDLQSQIQDPNKRREVARLMAMAEGWSGGMMSNLPDEEITGLVELVKSGKLTDKEALDKVSDDKKKSQLVAELSKIVKPSDTAADAEAKEKASLAMSLKDHKGLKGATGTTRLGRTSLFNKAEKQEFIGSVENLVSGLTLESLISAKERGATFGALSEGEMRVLASAATKIGTWAIKDKTGKTLGYRIGQDQMKKELENISNIFTKAIKTKMELDSANNPLGIDLNNPLGI